MLSISMRGNAAQAAKYYQHLESDESGKEIEDYYSGGGQGYFQGTGALILGLVGPVDRESFEELAFGRTPLGECQGAGIDHRAGWDLTWSSPKSVSVLWATADAETRGTIEAAHDNAVARSLKFMEYHAGYGRRGHGGQTHEKVGLVAAVYRHGTSRETDPHLHSHAMVFNVARRLDGTIGGIESKYFYEWKLAGGAAYRAELVTQLQKLGYTVERDGSSFKVTGVPQELCDGFSKRRRQIETELKRLGSRGAKASEIATLSTRKVKQEMDRETLIKTWQATAKGIAPKWKPEQCLNQPQHEIVPLDIKALQNEMTQKHSTLSEAQLYSYIGQDHQVFSSIAGIEKSVSEVKVDSETVVLQGPRGETRFTTKEMQTLEVLMVDRAERMSMTFTHNVSPEVIAKAMDARLALSDEQKAAVTHITKSNDLSVVQGDAGTGKSFMLSVAKDAWETEGYRVRGASLSGKAAQGLQLSSGIQSTTIRRFEMDTLGYQDERGQKHEPADKLTSKDIVVIDEAGMIGSRQTAALIEHAVQVGAKVVLIGDTRQLQAIDAGAAFRAISERVGSANLTDIRRQHDLQDRQAVRDLRDGRAEKALQNLSQRGRVHESETAREAKAQTGKAVAEDLAAGKRSLGLAGTRADVRDINEFAREAAKEKNLVTGADVTVSTANGEREFAVGDRVLFTRNNKNLDVKNGDLATLMSIEQRDSVVHFKAELDRGGERQVSTQTYDHLDLGYVVTCHKAQGSTVDRCHIFASENGMSSREWSYVAASRAKEETHIHADKYTLQELAPAWSKARQKDVSLDYQLAEEREYEKPRGKVREAHVQEPIFEFTRNN